MASDSGILHFGAVRMRATGNGNLQSELQSLDETSTQALANYPLNATTDKELTVLADFVNQRASLHLFTTNINETFQISKIIVYIKPIYTSFPM